MSKFAAFWPWLRNPWGMQRALTAALFCAVLCVASGQAKAETARRKRVAACARAFEQAQLLRNESRYLAAAKSAAVCSEPTCGSALLKECVQLYEDLQNATPSVVLSASAADGSDLTEVAVLIDDGLRVEALDGRPIRLDPGTHSFEFKADGRAAVSRSATLRAGEHFRQVQVTFAPEPRREPRVAVAVPSVAASASGRSDPTLIYVLGGVGAFGFGSFAILQIAGSREYQRLERSCRPDCSRSSINAVERTYTLSYVGLGLSIVGSVGALGVYLLQPDHSTSVASALSVAPLPGGVSARWAAWF